MLNPDTLSVQLYTLRTRLADEPDTVFADLAEIGFTQVEPFGLLGFRDALVAGLPKHGLTAPTSHASIGSDDLAATLDAAAAVGVKTVILPHTDPALWQSTDGIAQVAETLNTAAQAASSRDIQIGYHNHWFELETPFDAGTGLDVLAAQLEPGVVLEVDTYWALVGGADVPALLGRLGDRVFALHLKDGDGTRDNKAQVAAGQGTVPILDYVAAAPGMRYGVVELDDCSTDMTQAVRDSFAYLNGK